MAHEVAIHAEGELVQEAKRLKFGMWLFLASEIMFFGGFLSAYLITRLGKPMDMVLDWQKSLNMWLAGFNTLVLIASSLTMAVAVNSAKLARKKRTVLFLALTALLGTTFLVVKYFEYSAKIHHGLTPDRHVLYGFYYLLTGFHGLHVLAGVIALVTFTGLVQLCGWFLGEHRHMNVEILGLYWHFVDVVWIFLFPILYLI